MMISDVNILESLSPGNLNLSHFTIWSSQLINGKLVYPVIYITDIRTTLDNMQRFSLIVKVYL